MYPRKILHKYQKKMKTEVKHLQRTRIRTLKFQSETAKLDKIHPAPGKRNRGTEKMFSVNTRNN